jgi:hypothetical protein
VCQGLQVWRIFGPPWSLFVGKIRTTDWCGDAEGKGPWKKIILPLVPEVVPGSNGECVRRIAQLQQHVDVGVFPLCSRIIL